MITLIVFYLHVVGMAYVFTKRWQEEGTGEGLLAVFFMALIFFVGWSMSSFLLRLVMDQEGFGRWFDRDAASLVLLTCAEVGLSILFVRRAPPVSGGQP
jgi:uncharacterized membrane protein YhdT